MTSLAKQLQQLAVPHTQAVFGHDHSKPSLLFDPREAAQLDKETFFALGLNGLEELENIDPEFEKFEDTLFSESSQTFERSVQTKEANKKLDENISEFLTRLSPYFLLKPSHKALEWLIYRYHIHHYNEDDLMRCILPYHETKVFVRAVQILKLDRPDTKWDWLHPLQKSGVHLSKTTLINHCKTNLGFLGFLCETVQKFVKLHVRDGSDGGRLRVLFSFFTSTVIGVLELGGATEMTISTLIPHLTRGLKSKLDDHKASSYMILSQLCNKVKIKTSVLLTLLQVMAKHLSAGLLSEALSCMVLMFQTQKLETFPKKALKHLCRVPELTECVSKVCEQYQSCGLTRAILARLVTLAVKRGGSQSSATSSEGSEDEQDWTSAPPQYCHLLEDFIKDVPLSDQTAAFVARTLVEAYIDRMSEMSGEDDQMDYINQSLKGVVRILESRYSAALDSAMESLLTGTDSEETKSLIQKFVSLTLTSIQHHVVADDCSNLTLALCHRLGSVRRDAVNHLVQNLDKLQEDDEVFIEGAVLAGLKDDHFPVVKATLQIGKKLWSLVSDKGKLVSTLTSILQKGNKKAKRKHTLSQAMGVLCSCDADLQPEVFRLVYPYLLVVDSDGLDVAIVTAILESDLATSHALLSDIRQAWLREVQDWQKWDSIVSLNMCLVNNIVQTIDSMEEEKASNLVTQLLSSRQDQCVRPRSSQALSVLVLDRLLQMECTFPNRVPTIARAQLDMMRESLSSRGSFSELTTTPASFTVEAALKSVIKSLSKEKPLALPLCAGILLNVINSIHMPSVLVSGPVFWDLRNDREADECVKLMVTVFDLLLDLAAKEGGATVGTFRSLVIHSLQKHFSEPVVLMKFLGLLWSYHVNDQSADLGLNLSLQVRALHISLVQLEQLDQQHLNTLLQTADPVFTQLLVSLTSPVGSVREMVLRCLQVLEDRCDQTPFLPVIKRLVTCKEEIVADQEFLSQALLAAFGKLSETEGEARTPRKGKRKSDSKMAARKVALAGLLDATQREDTPLYITQNVLHSLRLLRSPEMTTQLLSLLKRLLGIQSSDIGSLQVKVIQQLLQRFTHQEGRILERDSMGLDLLLSALKSDLKVDNLIDVQDVALNQITKEFHDSLPSSDSKKRLLSCLLDVMTNTKSVAIGNLVRKVLKHVSLDAEHLCEELGLVLQAVKAGSVKEAKRLRREENEDVSPELENAQWQRVTQLLEVIQVKKKIHNSLQLVPVCFQVVARVLELEDSGTGEYLKQLILSCILNISTRQLDAGIDSECLKKQEFNMELIVQCIRSSDNPQTHHHALLLLTVAAKLQPEYLLHNVMSIFTFMGANILRQDDSYSFRVITKILETVIPSLITACELQSSKMKKSSTTVEDVITMVIRVFVDAYPHIPSHRRLMLFTKLVGIVGEERYLWRMLLMLVDHMITKAGAKPHTDEDDDDTEAKTPGLVASADMEFFLGLCGTFNPGVQLLSAQHMLLYLSSLPDDKQDRAGPKSPKQGSPIKFLTGKTDKVDSEVFNMDAHTAKQLRHFKYAAISLLVSLFESDSFIGQVANSEESSLLRHYEEFLKTILEYVTQLNKSVESNHNKPTSRFWRALQHKVHDLLDKVVSLLPGRMFYEVVSGLMKHSLHHVQRKAMELLNTKLQALKDSPADTEMAVLLLMVDELSAIAQINAIQSGDGEDKAVNGQTALFSLKLLCRHLGNGHPKPFVQVLELATKVFHTRGDNPQVAACGLLYVAEACNSLKVHIIQHLSGFMPKLIKVLKKEEDLLQNELLTLSAITAVHKVVENLTHFLSPYLVDIITCVCSLTTAVQQKPKLQKPQLQFRLTAVRGILATSLPTRVLLPSLMSSYDKVSTSKQECIVPMMMLLSDHISHMEKEELNSHNNQILSFFYICLDFRVTQTEVSLETVSNIEASVIDAIITMVMKLSEATFRPMIFKLCDWATRNEENKGRVLVFYRLADSLAEKLRSLFTLFAGHIIKHTARMLDENNRSKEGELFFGKGKKNQEHTSQLLQYLLGYLYKCFLYDNEGFVNKERFDTLMQPLADQIDNTIGGEAVYQERVLQHLVPCIAQFAVAAQDDASWRSLNYQILLKTRSSSAKVRYAALMVLDELHKKLGEDYMTLLPETIPFLAELMEDDSEEVERKCQSVIAEMEKTLGEPLQKYF